MKQLLPVYKPKGMTPYQLIQKLKAENPDYQNVPIGFAGRLDPLAHGVLLLMVGEETKNRDKYLSLPKEYEFEAIFGIATDSFDVLGILQNAQSLYSSSDQRKSRRLAGDSNQVLDSLSLTRTINFNLLEEKINKFINNHLGKQIQPYPPFSSKTVQGKPLYWWTRQNRLSEITIPTRQIEIYDFTLLSIRKINSETLQKNMMHQIASVDGDFRQKEIGEKWKIFFEINENRNFITARFKIYCSSGTYVRGLVNELGTYLDTGAVTLEILRTKVGDFDWERSRS